ncbi:hypothetical protein EWM64_g9285 [Hericium alpestre]|uniref:Indoleamine 2,3-dioxygenase n=1 Tax=Hericium alpestre TaxID=135208 RepID=A0A4Y9ZKZ0_9AGAM|nr:hypothetical protein EWM64_g9285 [Hericium alpestre]
MLDALRGTCAPEVFYNDVRPWFVGAKKEVSWVFEVDGSLDAEEALEGNKWLKRGEGGVWIADDISGTTAAQSTIIQALDVFLGIDAITHERPPAADGKDDQGGSKAKPQGNFLERIREYLPLAHREFFKVLAPQGLALREYIKEARDKELSEAYDAAIAALQRFRTIHVRIATLYVINQMQRAAPKGEVLGAVQTEKEARGTGGTMLMPFLKGIRDRTGESKLSGSSVE